MCLYECFFHSSTPALTWREYLAPTSYNEGAPQQIGFARGFLSHTGAVGGGGIDQQSASSPTFLYSHSFFLPPPNTHTPLLKQSSITLIPLCYHSLNLPPSSQPIRQSSSFWLAVGHPTPSLSVTLLLVAEQRLTAP